jgi:hypothetical protein
MPGKAGGELLEQAKAIHPNLRSLFMSGYAGDLVALRGGLMPEAAFLAKPFTKNVLLTKVYSVPRFDVLEPRFWIMKSVRHFFDIPTKTIGALGTVPKVPVAN